MSILLDDDRSYSVELTREFIRNVYTYMFAALGISGGLAYVVGTNESLFFSLFISASGGLSPLFYVIAFAPLGVVWIIQGAMSRLSLGSLIGLFILYSVLMGLSLSSVFMVYNIGSIISTFFVSAAAFGAMAVLGYTTKTDLTKFGSLLMMVFFGIFIAAIVNMFIGSSALSFWISVIGVFVFTGLTAYQMQQLKALANQPGLSAEERNKLSLIGGLQLYILFVNLFLSLLRLLGSRD
ncbi:MAG: hypothetical protein RL264_2916 [Bacteroidota bacterium]|jgi:FtsH-binding integral membrane protein